jgi:hypothetical protein
LLRLLPLPQSRIELRQVASAPVSNEIVSADGALRTSVGVYRDCSGVSPIPASEAALWSCVPGRMYFVGHNPGVFTPLMHMRLGDLLTYIDGSGSRHGYRIVRMEDWGRADGFPPPVGAAVVAQFQTCVTPDGSIDRIVDAVAVPS